MSENWKSFDLHGGGLQSANLRLARLLKRRRVAYALAALFPLGLHRDYLGERRAAWAFRTATAAAVACLLSGQPLLAALLAAVIAGAAVYDVVHMEDRIARSNKKIRMQVYMSQTEGAPGDFRGRMADDPGAEAGRGPRRAPSFAEQERLLRELAKGRDKDPR